MTRSEESETERGGQRDKLNPKKIQPSVVETCREEKMAHKSSAPIWPAGQHLPTIWCALTGPSVRVCVCLNWGHGVWPLAQALSIWRWSFMSSRSVTAIPRESRGNRPAESHATEERGDKGSRLARRPGSLHFLQELPRRGLMPSLNSAAAASSCLWGEISGYESTTANKTTDKALHHIRSPVRHTDALTSRSTLFFVIKN